jgi:Tfp pilus assembly protein PilF
MIARLEDMIATSGDSPHLRFGLASAYFREEQFEAALAHVSVAVELDADYSAAWRLLGRVHMNLGDNVAAQQALQRGIEVATRRGDQQLIKEMRVFLKRLQRAKD